MNAFNYKLTFALLREFRKHINDAGLSGVDSDYRTAILRTCASITEEDLGVTMDSDEVDFGLANLEREVWTK